jgi:hypothetical protein
VEHGVLLAARGGALVAADGRIFSCGIIPVKKNILWKNIYCPPNDGINKKPSARLGSIKARAWGVADEATKTASLDRPIEYLQYEKTPVRPELIFY